MLTLFRFGRLSSSRFEIKSIDNNLLLYLIPKPEHGIQVKVWIRKDKQALVAGYTDDPEIKVDVADYQFTLPELKAKAKDRYKVFLNSDQLKGVGRYFLSVLISFRNSK